MTHAGPADALARVRSALARSDDPRTDGQLLEAYRDRREPDAFTALVYRHGPRVLAVCQRITRHDHDADDACQAVFLVLARRAADVRTVSDTAYATIYPQVSPNGKTLLFMGMKLPEGIPEKPIDENKRLYLQPIGGKVSELPDVPLNAEIQGFSWFPDGKKIAYTWRRCTPKRRRPARSTTAKPNRTCAFATPTARTTKPS